ncbi:MAG: DUF6505 family protein [Rhodospirillales bacterium]|jgi:hypothetical protein
MKFLRTIHLDESDKKVFPSASAPGELAVPGTFSFSNMEVGNMSSKEQLAFKNGWLGLASFGRCTLVQIVDVTEEVIDEAVGILADHFVIAFGAPDRETALEAARAEVGDAVALCEQDPGTLLAIEREIVEDGISERIRIVKQAEPGQHAKIWTVVGDDE